MIQYGTYKQAASVHDNQEEPVPEDDDRYDEHYDPETGRWIGVVSKTIPACRACGCLGNRECGHDPAPGRGCELDATMQCYCCRMK
jgi:hypothetical protein